MRNINVTPKKRVAYKHWADMSHQRLFFDQLGNKLNIKHPDDWYQQISWRSIIEAGGSALLKHYKSSPFAALKTVYPDHDWKPWRFSAVPKRFWNDPKNVMEYLKWFTDQYDIKTLEDWNGITREQFERSGGSKLLQKYGGVPNIISTFFPDYRLKTTTSPLKIGRTRMHLFNTLQQLLPNTTIIQNYKTDKLLYQQTNREMELDFFLPQYSLAIEYHSDHHYMYHYVLGPAQQQQQKDKEKQLACSQNGIKLVEIPFWWDRSKSSLLATLHENVPEVFPVRGNGTPIPVTMPQKYVTKQQRIEKSYLGSQLTKPKEWKQDMDPSGWWMCECPHGTRALWDKLILVSEDGKRMDTSPWPGVIPPIKLDVIISNQNGRDTITVLDALADVPFEQRKSLIETFLKNSMEGIQMAPYTWCSNANEFEQLLRPKHHVFLKHATARYNESLWEVVKPNVEQLDSKRR